ncbi:MAG: hypothetical protein J2P31_10315 [Blastocatellia bacterium]|nr:hypothetical protein [Blastocatellia bacterium]
MRKVLGKSDNYNKDQDNFKIDGDNTLTTLYDNDSVKMIQLYFLEPKKAPSWVDVVGDTNIEQRPDGSKLAEAEIQEENFRVSMFQSKSGDVTTITISRIHY